MFIENKTLQLVLVEPGDLVINEHVQTKEPIPIWVELEDFQRTRFKMTSIHLTLSNIKTTYVFVHHYHNLPIQKNSVVMNNDANDVFRKAFIDVYLLGVSSPKGYVHL
jgi:hypothetical protein